MNEISKSPALKEKYYSIRNEWKKTEWWGSSCNFEVSQVMRKIMLSFWCLQHKPSSVRWDEGYTIDLKMMVEELLVAWTYTIGLEVWKVTIEHRKGGKRAWYYLSNITFSFLFPFSVVSCHSFRVLLISCDHMKSYVDRPPNKKKKELYCLLPSRVGGKMKEHISSCLVGSNWIGLDWIHNLVLWYR